MPSLPIAIVVGVGLLLTAALAYVLFGRNRRAPLRQAAAGPTPPATPAPTPTGAPVAPPPPAPSRTAQWWPRVRPVLKWAAAIAVLFWLYGAVPSWFDGGITVGTEWSKIYAVPVGERVIFSRRENVAYDIVSQDEIVHHVPRREKGDPPCKGYVRITERLMSFQVRVSDPEAERMTLDLRFVPANQSSPCIAEP